MRLKLLIALSLLVAVLSSCGMNATYQVYEENDVWYLEFEPEKLDELTYDYDEDNYQHFNSVSQMRRAVKYGALSDNQLITMEGHARNNTIELGDLDNWREITYPRDFPYEHVTLYGPDYYFTFNGGSDQSACTGSIHICYKERYEKEFESYTYPSAGKDNPISDNKISYRNTTAREFTYKVNYNNGSTTFKRLFYHLQGKNAELYFIETYYIRSDSTFHKDKVSESIPNQIMILGTDGKDYFYGTIRGFEQFPSTEWLSSFGLK